MEHLCHSNQPSGIDQISLFKLKENVTDSEFNQFVEGANSLTAIPGVRSVTVDRNVIEPWMMDNKTGGGFTHAMRIKFASKDALRQYQDQPIKTGLEDFCLNEITDGTMNLYLECPSNLEAQDNRRGFQCGGYQCYDDSAEEEKFESQCTTLSSWNAIVLETLSCFNGCMPRNKKYVE